MLPCLDTFFHKGFVLRLFYPSDGGTYLWSLHSRGRGRRISEFEARQDYIVSSRTTRPSKENPVSEEEEEEEEEKEEEFQYGIGLICGQNE